MVHDHIRDNLEMVSEIDESSDDTFFQGWTWQLRYEVLEIEPEEIPVALSPEKKLKLKPLPEGLKYVNLGDGNVHQIVISSVLDIKQEKKLVALLKNHIEALGWTLYDLKRINHLICTNRI